MSFHWLQFTTEIYKNSSTSEDIVSRLHTGALRLYQLGISVPKPYDLPLILSHRSILDKDAEVEGKAKGTVYRTPVYQKIWWSVVNFPARGRGAAPAEKDFSGY